MKPTLPENLVPRRYRVLHVTRYTYERPVERCYERGALAPRPCPGQTVASSTIEVTPTPAVVSEHTDAFGNLSHYVEVLDEHTLLEVRKTFEVDIAARAVGLSALNAWTVAQAADAIRADRRFIDDRLWYELPSDLTPNLPQVRAYAATHFSPDTPLGDALAALTHGIYADFAYKPGATTVKTTLAELLDLRAGVCQDFAHLALACLRASGLPCRYVSGYIETIPPPGQPKLEGADATHAWLSVLAPDGTWVDLDPTNDQCADSRYVVNAWGRDFGDVSPLKGIIVSEANRSTLAVEVTVTRLT